MLGVENFPPSFPDEDIVIANNIIDGTNHGVSFFYDSANDVPQNTYLRVKVLFNVIHDVHSVAIAFWTRGSNSSPPSECVLAGNIVFAPSDSDAVDIADPSAWTFADNDFPNGVPPLGSGPGTLAKDPMLVAPSIATTGAGGFHLQTGSPCTGAAHAMIDAPIDFACSARATPMTSMGVFGP